MPFFPLDEHVTSAEAEARVATLRAYAEGLQKQNDAAYASYAAACKTLGEIEAELARCVEVERAASAGWRPNRTILPIEMVQPVEPARIVELRELARMWRAHADQWDARRKAITRQLVDAIGELRVIEARQAERFRTGPLLSPGGTLLPPRIVRR